MRFLRVVLFLFFAQLALSQQPSTASLRGVVVKAGSHDAVAKATVELRVAGSAMYTATTERDGAFVFRDVRPGRYGLVAIRSGYASTPLVPVTLAAGQETAGVEIALTPGAVILGRVTDRLGQPLGNAEVQAATVAYRDGHRVLGGVKAARTNDLGEYQLFWLAPGSYYVSVLGTGQRDLVVNSGAGAFSSGVVTTQYVAKRPPVGVVGEKEVYVPIYFPETPDWQSAIAIEVRAGEEVPSVDLRAVPVMASEVRGSVTEAGTGVPVPAGEVRIVPASSDPSPVYTARITNGSFTAQKVLPGNYVLYAIAGNGAAARVSLEVRNTDVNLTVGVKPSFSVPAKVTLDDGSNLANDPRIAGMQMALRSIPQIQGVVEPRSQVGSDGGIVFQGVRPGDYRVFIPFFEPPSEGIVLVPRPGLESAYLKSIRLGTSDLLGAAVSLDRQPDERIEIVIGMDGASLTGHVVADGERVPDAVVALVSASAARFRKNLDRIASTSALAEFQFQHVPPGDYKLFAWQNLQVGARLDPDFLKQYEDSALRLTLRGSAQENVDLKLTVQRQH